MMPTCVYIPGRILCAPKGGLCFCLAGGKEVAVRKWRIGKLEIFRKVKWAPAYVPTDYRQWALKSKPYEVKYTRVCKGHNTLILVTLWHLRTLLAKSRA